MKVLYLANPLRSGTGGDRRSFEVLRRIAKLGVESVIVVDDFVWQKMKRSGDTWFSPNQKVYSVKRANVVYDKRFKSASRAALDYYSIQVSARQIAQIARQEHVELIVSEHEKIDFLLEAHHAAEKCRVPWTCVFQSFLFPPYASTPWRRVSTSRKAYLFALYGLLYARILEAAKSTILLAVSPSIEVDIKRYFGGWQGKMHVLRPGVAVEQQKIQQAQPSNEKVDAIFFSRLVPEKGIYDLPKVAAELAREKPDFKLWVLGRFDSAAMRSRFEGLVASNSVGKNVVYGGYREGPALYGLVKAAKVLVYPSQHDAFPLVVLEALAAGTPVVAYDIPAIKLNFPPDIVRKVPVGDAKAMAAEAQKLIVDDKLRTALSERALAFAAGFSWDNAVAAERQAYESVLR